LGKYAEILDSDLLAQYKQSSNQEFLAALYWRYQPLVQGVCYKYLQDMELAKDATMDIYQELVTKCLQHEIANFKAWLHTVARNHCLMKLRKNNPVVPMPEQIMQNEEVLHLEDKQALEEQFKKMEICLEQLAATQRTSVELFYLQKKCYKEIAEQLGIEWNKVRSTIQNGRRNLKICMEQQVVHEQQ
jgi:RNA polymerase sigma factor (sigma-70 family)